MEYTENNPLRGFTSFSGYDSQSMALDRLKEMHPGFDYELVGWSEIDRHAIKAHNLVYPQWAGRNFGDITKIDWALVPDFDMFTFSSPCQDFSSAGLQKGGAEGSGTRSSLLWFCENAIREKRPKYMFMENVKNLVSKRFRPLFYKWVRKGRVLRLQNLLAGARRQGLRGAAAPRAGLCDIHTGRCRISLFFPGRL